MIIKHTASKHCGMTIQLVLSVKDAYFILSLCGLPQVRLQPLDGVLRMAARMIGVIPKFGHISDFIHSFITSIYIAPLQVGLLKWGYSVEIHSTGSLSGSTFSTASPPLFGVVSLALRLLTYLTSSPLHRSALADNLSTLPPEVILWYLMIAQPLNSIGPTQLWVPLLGTVSHLSSALFLGICPVCFTSSLKPLFSPGAWAGLSSYLEVVLYKFHR